MKITNIENHMLDGHEGKLKERVSGNEGRENEERKREMKMEQRRGLRKENWRGRGEERREGNVEEDN